MSGKRPSTPETATGLRHRPNRVALGQSIRDGLGTARTICDLVRLIEALEESLKCFAIQVFIAWVGCVHFISGLLKLDTIFRQKSNRASYICVPFKGIVWLFPWVVRL